MRKTTGQLGVLAWGRREEDGDVWEGGQGRVARGITLARLWQGSWIRLGGFITCSSIVLGQAFHTKVLGDGQERVELVLSDVNFSMIHEVEHSQQVGVLNAFQVQKRVLMWILPQHAPEEGAAGGQNHLVGLDLVIVTG